MKLLIAADIFGNTPAFNDLADQLSFGCKDTIRIDPYPGRAMNFKNEADAYACFQATVGLDNYINKISSVISGQTDDLLFIGFSVGASALWVLSGRTRLPGPAICFYGSQIRHHLDVEPDNRVQLIFPEHEPHFNVETVIKSLSDKQGVTCTTVPFKHGFMNRLSTNFDSTGYQTYIHFITMWVQAECNF
jgi:dienelactone hydrolase